MSWIPIVTEDQANAEVQRMYAYIRERWSFVPNYFYALGRNAQLLQDQTHLYTNAMFDERPGGLPRLIKEQIATVVSALNTSTYCLAAHMEILGRLGMPRPVVPPLPPPSVPPKLASRRHQRLITQPRRFFSLTCDSHLAILMSCATMSGYTPSPHPPLPRQPAAAPIISRQRLAMGLAGMALIPVSYRHSTHCKQNTWHVRPAYEFHKPLRINELRTSYHKGGMVRKPRTDAFPRRFLPGFLPACNLLQTGHLVCKTLV